MSAGFGSGAPARGSRRGGLPSELKALQVELAQTPAQRCLRIWTDAGNRSDLFAQLMVTALQIEQRVTKVLQRSGAIGEDHGSLVRLMALSLTSGLLDERGMKECRRACPM